MGARKRILLVDDDSQVLFVLQAALRRMDLPCDVETAQNGREAFRLVEAFPFDLLITDIRLPGIDGITLTDLVRSRAPQMPVIWITAYGCHGLRDDAARLCVFRCLEKPVEVDAFRQIVQQAILASFPDVAGDCDAPSAHPIERTGRKQ